MKLYKLPALVLVNLYIRLRKKHKEMVREHYKECQFLRDKIGTLQRDLKLEKARFKMKSIQDSIKRS